MMQRIMLAAAAALAMISAAVPGVANAAPPPGVWTNPNKSVRVAFQRCGDAMCGKVIWASPKAQADAQAGGGGPLVGSMLFQNFVEQDRGEWSGSVLIPDLGQTVSGTIRQTDANTLIGEGCLIAGLACKSQIWTRMR